MRGIVFCALFAVGCGDAFGPFNDGAETDSGVELDAQGDAGAPLNGSGGDGVGGQQPSSGGASSGGAAPASGGAAAGGTAAGGASSGGRRSAGGAASGGALAAGGAASGGTPTTGGASSGGRSSGGTPPGAGGKPACDPVIHHNGFGQTWTDCVPLRTWNLEQATKACEASDADCYEDSGCGRQAICSSDEPRCWLYGELNAGVVWETPCISSGAGAPSWD